MPFSRRDFLRTSVAAAGGVVLHSATAHSSPPASRRQALNILIVGGTSFLGPHLVHYALQRGHSISIFTRGTTQPTIYKPMYRDVEHLIGDRASDHSALRGRRWDVVIDTSGWQYEWAVNSCDALRDATDFYMYTSSIGVYHPYKGASLDENTPVLDEDPPSVPQDQRPSYGVMKVLSERYVRETFGADRVAVIRPTYIVGPADSFNRFPYWPLRLERGGEVLVPGKEEDPIQFIDVRDLTEFMVRLVETKTTGVYNVAAPSSALSNEAFIYGIQASVSSDVEIARIPDHDFLREQRLRFVIPVVLPIDDYAAAMRINIDRAKSAGLTFRPLAVTSLDTLEWWHSDSVSEERKQTAWSGPRSGGFALNPEREQEILRAWRERG